MALAFVQGASAADAANDTSAAVSLTGVAAGSLIVLFAKWEGVTGATVTVSDGTSSLTVLATNGHTNNDLHAAFAYLLVANSGSRTYTATWSAGRPFKWLHVREYSYTGTASFDLDNVTAEGTSAGEPTSGTITTTGTDEVVIGGVGAYGDQSYTTPLIGGAAAANTIGDTTSTYTWSRLLTATMTNGTAAVTDASGWDWVCSVVSFKVTAGSTNMPVPVGAVAATGLAPTRSVFDPLANDARIVIRRSS